MTGRAGDADATEDGEQCSDAIEGGWIADSRRQPLFAALAFNECGNGGGMFGWAAIHHGLAASVEAGQHHMEGTNTGREEDYGYE